MPGASGSGHKYRYFHPRMFFVCEIFIEVLAADFKHFAVEQDFPGNSAVLCLQGRKIIPQNPSIEPLSIHFATCDMLCIIPAAFSLT